jgi:MYXO-CTERM domain-containing protein
MSRFLSSRAALISLMAGAFVVTAPQAAHAHFILQQPPASQTTTDTAGDPQKLGPCGGETPTQPTNIVTTYQEGETITITVDQTVAHSGHWRVSLGMTGPSSLPPEPVVTATTATPCGSAAIENPPVFPVIGDDLLDSTTGATGVANMQVTLPPGVTCTNCTLQVIEFMSNHGLNNPGGCFYHHCAQINIVAGDAGATSTSSTSSMSTASGSSTQSTGGATTTSSGGGPTTSGGATSGTSHPGSGGSGSGTTATSGSNGANTGNGSSGSGGAQEADGGAGETSSSSGGCNVASPGAAASTGATVFAFLALAGLFRKPRRR